MESCVAQLYEKFPHIQRKLHEVWGTKKGRDYLTSLLFVDRDHRAGFPFDVIEVIDLLIDDHDKAFPTFKPAESPWDVQVSMSEIVETPKQTHIESFTKWADEKFGKVNPSTTARIYPQHERFESFFKCWVDAKSGNWD